MTYHFECPRGHMLAAEPADAGGQCRCPECGVLFVIPQPPREPVTIETGQRAPSSDAAEVVANLSTPPPVLHIRCPNGHILETPREMLNQAAICPHCQTQFVLRETQSEEYRRKREVIQQTRDSRMGRAWLNWAIVLVVIVLTALALLLIL